MKITIVTAEAAFERGEAGCLANGLGMQCGSRGHQVEIVRVPFQWHSLQTVADHMLACRLLRVDTNEPDLVVALNFPAYLAPCPNKKIWLVREFRPASDAGDSDGAGVPMLPEERRMRDLIVRADTSHLRQEKAVFTISGHVAGRLKRVNGVDIDANDVLYPPPDRPELFRPEGFDDYFFFPSRLSTAKRQHVAVEAMRHVRSPIRLILAGNPDTEQYGQNLRRCIEEWELQDRVTLLGPLPDEEKARWMANCCAVVYPPHDEDYGYVPVEAFHSHKPVVICTDCGGATELVEDKINGLVVEPTPEALAAAMEALWSDRPRTRSLGLAAFETLACRGIEWDYVVDRLLA